ncbi:MAG TPA: hypothetical protein VGR73_23190 [Bryobacteraceae bacterium]|nr:hypothetical protein [Bryobacteraceae bacterium]
MSPVKLHRTAAFFFWIAAVTTVACVAVILLGNTKFLWRLERRDFPLSWALAGVAALAFLLTELCHSLHRSREERDESSRPAPLDTDKDGKVSKQEFLSYMEAEFDRLDKEKRGELDAEKLRLAQLAHGRTIQELQDDQAARKR